MVDELRDEEITQPEPFSRDRACARLALIEHELAELWRMFHEAQPGLAAAQFAADTAGTAFVGVNELRNLIRDEMAQNRLTLQQETSRMAAAANNRTKLAIAAMLAMSTVCGATIGALMTSNLAAARAEAGKVAEDVTSKKLQVLEHRDKLLCDQCADEAIVRRDRQIDSIAGRHGERP